MIVGVATAAPGALALALARLVLAGVLLGAALAKVGDPKGFVASVANYRIVPQRLVPIVAGTVTVTELASGLLLAGDLMTPWAAGAAAVLLGAFAAAMALNLVRHRHIDCGCSATDRDISWELVGRDVILAAAAVIVAAWSPPVPFDASVAVVITALAALAGGRLVGYARRVYRLQHLLVEALDREPACPGHG